MDINVFSLVRNKQTISNNIQNKKCIYMHCYKCKGDSMSALILKSSTRKPHDIEIMDDFKIISEKFESLDVYLS